MIFEKLCRSTKRVTSYALNKFNCCIILQFNHFRHKWHFLRYKKSYLITLNKPTQFWQPYKAGAKSNTILRYINIVSTLLILKKDRLFLYHENYRKNLDLLKDSKKKLCRSILYIFNSTKKDLKENRIAFLVVSNKFYEILCLQLD